VHKQNIQTSKPKHTHLVRALPSSRPTVARKMKRPETHQTYTHTHLVRALPSPRPTVAREMKRRAQAKHTNKQTKAHSLAQRAAVSAANGGKRDEEARRPGRGGRKGGELQIDNAITTDAHRTLTVLGNDCEETYHTHMYAKAAAV
jgi:hypothetical protein